MAYHDIALLSSNNDFVSRVAASYAVEVLANPDRRNPSEWATAHAWDMAAQPGFGQAYAYAVANGNEAPGLDPAVVTDEQILAAVQSLIAL